MRLQPFFTYYGGKWRLAPHYPAPQYDTIIEPFAGSAGYSLMYPERRVILNDLDPTIAGVWTYLKTVSESEVRRLPLDGDMSGLPQEARDLIGFWFNKGAAAPGRSPSAWMRSGIRPNSYWGEAIRERIASQVQYIRHWQVMSVPYAGTPDDRATWFIDPPYSSKAGRLYRVSDIDYRALGDWSMSRRGQVIVCESEGADWLPFVSFRDAKASEAKHGGKRSREAIWTA